ncbi:hypothetical protein BGAL_0346g00100 [Botrytis galanthina]|uniref:Uncharacterized protein n=1 Tax=Botrytis galanthina TaxID=278940 RepID=A0A4S8QRU6_9HELO|nr:hypothetical protein BGAL_0346g00100 [Botrytis galanthina]
MASVESESYVQRDCSFNENRNQYIRGTDRRSLSNSPDYNSRTYTSQTYSPPHYTLSEYSSPPNTIFTDVSSHIYDEDLNISEERPRNTRNSQHDAIVAQNSITTSSEYNDYLWQGTSYPSLDYGTESIYNSHIDPSLWNCTTMNTGPITPLPVVTEAQSILDEQRFKQCWDIPSLEAANSVQINEYAGVTFPSCMVGQASIARTASVNSFRSASSGPKIERELASSFFDMTESMTIRSQSPGEESYRSESTSGSPTPSIAEKSSTHSRKRRLQDRNDPNHVNRRGDTGRRKLDRYFCTRCNAFPKGWKLPEDLRKHNQGHHTETGFYCASGVDENCAYWSSQESRYIDHLKVEHASSRISQEIIQKYNNVNGITPDGSYMCRIPGCEKVYKRAERGRRDKHEERKAAHVFKGGLGNSVDPALLFPNSHVGCTNDETKRHVNMGQRDFAHSGPARESGGVGQGNRHFE